MDDSLRKALKKAKRKQVLKISGIATVIVLILLPIIFKTGDYFAGKSAERLRNALYLNHALTQPNVQIDSQVKSGNGVFGGNIVTHRSKDINGYLVKWSTLTSSYNPIFSHLDHNELVPGFRNTDNGYYEYDKQTKQKSATFYHPEIEDYYFVQDELKDVVTMDNYMAEVAISFDRPYSFEEVQEKIPDDLNISWLYMLSENVDESMGPSGVQVFGFAPSSSPQAEFDYFVQNLEEYDQNGRDEVIQKFLEVNRDQEVDEVKVLGVLLTGRTESFNALVDEDYIRGSSVGVTVEMVPYLTPNK